MDKWMPLLAVALGGAISAGAGFLGAYIQARLQLHRDRWQLKVSKLEAVAANAEAMWAGLFYLGLDRASKEMQRSGGSALEPISPGRPNVSPHEALGRLRIDIPLYFPDLAPELERLEEAARRYYGALLDIVKLRGAAKAQAAASDELTQALDAAKEATAEISRQLAVKSREIA